MLKTHILLSTYQGEKFLGEQLDSLIQQDFKNWELWIRDDGSSDKTIEIIEKYLQQDSRINFIKDNFGNQGPAQSFGLLLTYVLEKDPAYVMLCDQDDIWLPQKISKALSHMQTQEKLWGEGTPLLAHTDLIVVDKNLKEISPSFFAYQHQNPAINSPNRLLMQNTVTGCASMLNKALLQKLKPHKQAISVIPKEAVMHDMWIALIASFFGKICPMTDPSAAQILYRQHGLNDTGAKKFGIKNIKNLLKSLKKLQQKEWQARVLLECYGEELNENQQELLSSFGHLSSKNFFIRRFMLCRYGFYLQGFLRNFILFLVI